ncbi:MAG: hypothetical protein P8166_00150 [Candidatus Thiodiazotropha sp.]
MDSPTESMKMETLMRQPLLLIALLLFPLIQCAHAEENDRFLIQDSEGFVTTLPNVSDITVTQHLLELEQDLKIELSRLKDEVQRKSFKAIDTLVSVVMPGGLLYAKLRLDSYKKSERKMNRVNDELTQISGELVAFQADNGEWMVATTE